MSKAKMRIAILCLILVGAMLCNMAGCAASNPDKRLSENVTPKQENKTDEPEDTEKADESTDLEETENQKEPDNSEESDKTEQPNEQQKPDENDNPDETDELDEPVKIDNPNAAITDFAVRLLQSGEAKGENTLLSPLSVLCALAMTANGAEGETRAQMEATLGMTVEELNSYLSSYIQSLPQGKKYKLSIANSIWFAEDFSANQGFLDAGKNFYGADIYNAPFNNQTLYDINNWVNQKTNGMIPKILDKISEDSVMYLINALAFEAEWTSIYYEDSVREKTFTREDGTELKTEFMFGSVGDYYEDEYATGFLKYYSGGKYAFVALLPNEGIAVSEYIASLDGEQLHQLLSNTQDAKVINSIPKFEVEFDAELSDMLKEMGMERPFDEINAEFEGLGTADANLYISRVIHKTFISVGERGTKAGAATLVDIPCGSAPPQEIEYKYVYLDRPFVYMLIDCENQLPFFIGTMMEP